MATQKYPLRFRAALACRIVNLDRVKFNDAAANKLYPCAPATIAGSARIFDEPGLLPLYYFARLSEFGLPAGRAGALACEMANAASLESSEPATRIIYVHGAWTSGFFVANRIKDPATGEIKDNYDPEHETPNDKYPTGYHYPGNGRTIFTVEFYVKHVREMIAERIAYERSLLGEEEDE
jgi:hypothetical protein